ncbi:MAG: Crp/Fnr family transcriptional regulator [Deltaproteobacteria bacterium]|nr:Crp/Fnr family transcriptional regulator [Deltaproteobacteria bacterium]
MGELGTLYERFGRAAPAGTVLFREGEPGHDMYVIQAGRVELLRRVKDRESVLAVLPPGEFFGEMAILNNRPRSATAVVVEDARLLVIGPRTFEAMIRGSAEIAVRMIKKLAGRLEQGNQQIETLLLRDANHRVVHVLRKVAESLGRQSDGGVYIPISLGELAGRVGLQDHEVAEVLERLAQAKLIMMVDPEHALEGEEQSGYVIPEVGRLQDFLEFLEMKERFGQSG